jgi:hypothetical protein
VEPGGCHGGAGVAWGLGVGVNGFHYLLPVSAVAAAIKAAADVALCA